MSETLHPNDNAETIIDDLVLKVPFQMQLKLHDLQKDAAN